MKKFLSRILALLLVLVLIVNISPIRVQASALPEVVGVVTKVIPFNPGAGAAAGGAALGAQVFGWVLLGLGLIVTTAQAIDLMNQYTEFSGELETSIYYYPDGSWSYGVDMGFVERVRAFLFDTGVLSDPILVLSENDRSVYNAALADYLSLGFESCYVILAINDTATSSGYNKASFGQYEPVLENGRYSAYDASGNRVYFVTYTLKGSYYQKTAGGTTPWPGVETYIFRSGGAVSTDSSIELGQVALSEVDIPTGYPEWHTNARPATNPDTDEEITVLPIPLDPNTEELPDGMTQPDIWQGSIADPLPDMETVPDGSIAQTPWQTFKKWISEFFIPSGDITMYSLDLTELFPFCIPFDIFDLLSALRADPVAPVFELELDFGVTKAPITVDLSGWSDLASIIRILEVGLFCLGLALGTKELIGS